LPNGAAVDEFRQRAPADLRALENLHVMSEQSATRGTGTFLIGVRPMRPPSRRPSRSPRIAIDEKTR
jgi:hypothetical protein